MSKCQFGFLVVLILGSNGSLINAQSSVLCPIDYFASTESGTCIRLVIDIRNDWFEARSFCQNEGGDLVKILNSDMNDEIYDAMNQTGVDIGDLDFPYLWIGLNDLVEQDKYVWLEEEIEAEWTNWRSDEPSLDSQHCALYILEDNGEWVDQYCDISYHYVCEIPAPISSTVTASTTGYPVTTGSYNTMDGLSTSSAAPKPPGTPATDTSMESASTTTPIVQTEALTSTRNAFSEVTCLSGWTESQASGTCIKLSTDEKSWSDSRVSCQTEGGDLVKIISEQMNDFIAEKIIKKGGGLYWIGLHDEDQDGIFEWLDETTESTYMNWHSSQPNNLTYDGLDQYCVEMGFDGAEYWNDAYCFSLNNYICERSSEDSSEAQERSTTGISTTLVDIIIGGSAIAFVGCLVAAWQCGRRQGRKLRKPEPIVKAAVFQNSVYSVVD